MKRWQQIIPGVLVGLGLMASGLLMQTAHSQDEGAHRKMIYLFSTDFPPNPASQYPTPPLQQTQFWKFLDREMKLNGNLALTENMEQADYRVELRCSGMINCSKLIVDIKTLDRDVLATFPIRGVRPVFGLWGWPNLERVAHQLTTKLDERFRLLEEGGYGYTNE